VSTTAPPIPPPRLPEPPPEEPPSGWRSWTLPHVGGVLTSVATTILAFLIAGLVVLFTGHNPLEVYKGIFQGAGLDWFLPWVTGSARADAAFNLQQTLLQTTTLILTGLAVAFAFRCGLFNIGGQGQWTMGAIVSVWVGSSWAGLAGPAHIIVTIVLAALAGAAFAGIAGFLKATVGAHEVVTTIMLNGIAVNLLGWALNGPLKYRQEGGQVAARTPNFPTNALMPDLGHLFGIRESVHLSWLLPLALVAAVVVWFVIRRMRVGYEARVVGSTPGAARAGGISVGFVQIKLFALSGALAGLIGMQQLLADKGYLPVNFVSQLGFTGIAVAFLGQNNAGGIVFSSVLWGILSRGESALQLETDVPREFVIILQGILILSVMIIYQIARRRLARRRIQAAAAVQLEAEET
jgi:ABC-type uncharacterized transport system permease subunit